MRIKDVRASNSAIEAIDDAGNIVFYFRSKADAGRAGFNQVSIGGCLNYPDKIYKGWRWRRAGVLPRFHKFVREHCTTEVNTWPAAPREVHAAYLASLPEAWRPFADTFTHTHLWAVPFYWRKNPR